MPARRAEGSRRNRAGELLRSERGKGSDDLPALHRDGRSGGDLFESDPRTAWNCIHPPFQTPGYTTIWDLTCPRICTWTPPTKDRAGPHVVSTAVVIATGVAPTADARCLGLASATQGRRLLDRLPAQPAGPGPGVAITAHLGKDEVFNHALAAVVDAGDREHAALKSRSPRDASRAITGL